MRSPNATFVDLESATQLLDRLASWKDEWHTGEWVFRGQPDSDMRLIANVFRPKTRKRFQRVFEAALRTIDPGFEHKARMTALEVHLFLNFVRAADAQRGSTVLPGDGVELRRYLPFPSKFGACLTQWPPDICLPALALAQHHGTPTRLLDWTYDPYVACYFAASSAASSKSERFAVWALDLEAAVAHPFQPPTGFNANVSAQHGLFLPVTPSYQRDVADTPYALEDTLVSRSSNAPLFTCFTLPTSLAGETLRRLAHARVSAAQLYPGPYGAARHVEDMLLWDVDPARFDEAFL